MCVRTHVFLATTISYGGYLRLVRNGEDVVFVSRRAVEEGWLFLCPGSNSNRGVEGY